MVNFKAVLYILALVGAVNAVISGIVPRKKPFKVTGHSQLPVTFTTRNSPTNAQDFSVVFGIAPASDHIVEQQLGEHILQAFNLLKQFPTGTPFHNFTLFVTLTKDDVSVFPKGKFTITAAATQGFGALYGTQVEFFRENITLHW